MGAGRKTDQLPLQGRATHRIGGLEVDRVLTNRPLERLDMEAGGVQPRYRPLNLFQGSFDIDLDVAEIIGDLGPAHIGYNVEIPRQAVEDRRLHLVAGTRCNLYRNGGHVRD